MFYVYCLQSVDESERFYIGCTCDLRRRLDEHNAGENRSTKNSHWHVVYYEAYVTETAARLREQRLKKHGRLKHALMKRIKESLNM